MFGVFKLISYGKEAKTGPVLTEVKSFLSNLT